MTTLLRVLPSVAALVLSGLIVQAQTTTDLFPALKMAARQTSLEANGLRPWHLKLEVALTNKDGKQQSGTIEEWHNGPAQSRVDYDLPFYHGSVVHVEDALYRSPGLAPPPFELSHLEAAVLHPLPSADVLDGMAVTPVEPDLPEGLFRCVALAPKEISVPPHYYSMWPTYCFDPKALGLEASVEYSLVTLRVKVDSFLDTKVPTQLTVTENGRPYASAHVIELQSSAGPYARARAIDGLVRQPPDPLVLPNRVKDIPVTKVTPVYPRGAKQARITGTVWLHTIVGVDGHVRVLSTITSPSDDLAAAASEAVRQWVYHPYLQSGVPVEVYIDVAVNFTLG